VHVHRNDAITLEQVEAWQPERIVVSPGPCTPNEAGMCLRFLDLVPRTTPILGVCLGHQAIGQVFGGHVVRAPEPMHGKLSGVVHRNQSVFEGINGDFLATRYHSLTIAPSSLPATLSATASADDDVIMGVMHKAYPVHGVQFHPESIASENGHRILKNFLDLARDFNDTHRARPAAA